MKTYNNIKIGDLVTLSSSFKKLRFHKGTSPIYRWVIGSRGHIVTAKFASNQTAIVTRIDNVFTSDPDSRNYKAYRLLTDSGDVGWFCEGAKWLIKN